MLQDTEKNIGKFITKIKTGYNSNINRSLYIKVKQQKLLNKKNIFFSFVTFTKFLCISTHVTLLLRNCYVQYDFS